ncbi:hypothetical protein SeMB42_g04037 [Synchytrium endobioticum]|uniref:EF-hand domain-containing protein n=1 Tax=Synchytrium endobioticum TaxID=286115 RepID=A0A507CVP5_9FUNG|nr:hypothetical protein SeLEV6574_g05187 [Synchytrium endobioticum]TPX45370.1 hypothetical protein SeMB42_g04037 [Synchytrium endobioticum]
MGNSESLPLSPTELQIMEECTFFTRSEILRVYSKFMSLVISYRNAAQESAHNAEDDVRSGKKRRKCLTKMEFADTEELKHNPFKERIADVFSADGVHVNFDDYLDFASVFSEEAGYDVKSFYAFRIYDHNNDGYLDEHDIRDAINKIAGPGLTEEDKKIVALKVVEESDMDGDGRISFVEFERIVEKSPEFVDNFKIRIV